MEPTTLLAKHGRSLVFAITIVLSARKLLDDLDLKCNVDDDTSGEEKGMICFNFEAFIIIGSNDKNF